MSTLFKQLSELIADRQEVRITIKKIEGDLVVLAVTDFKNKPQTIEMSGTPEEMDENFIGELQKPFEAIKGFVSNADEVTEKVTKVAEKKEKSEAKASPAKKKSSSSKKSAAPKKAAPAKKAASKAKPEPKKRIRPSRAKVKPVIQQELAIDTKGPSADEIARDKETEELKQKAIEFEVLMDNAKKHLDAKDYKVAVEMYEKAKILFPEESHMLAALEAANKKYDLWKQLNEEVI